MTIDAVLFDLDGTLFDRDTAVSHLVSAQFEAFSSELGSIGAQEFTARVLALDDHGHRRKDEVYAVLAEERGLAASLAARLTADFWARYHHHCVPFADAHETLRTLRTRGTRLGVITNGVASIQNATIDALALRKLLDVVLVSESVRVRKPDAAVFHHAADLLGLLPERCCFVGDHPDVDVVGASAAGFHAIWKRTPYYVPPPAQSIDTLSDLLTLV